MLNLTYALSMQIQLNIGAFSTAAADIQSVRQQVFQQEQGVAPAVDFDGLDELSEHIVVYVDGIPIGTARIRYLNQQLAKIERVAVITAYRNQGIGKRIMQAAIAYLDQKNVPESKVHAQSHAAAFYQKLGFEPQGEEFYEAAILHLQMRRQHPQLKANLF